MADSTSPASPEALFSQDAAAKGTHSSWFGKLKLLLFAVSVVLVECVIAYLLIPVAAETPAMAAKPAKAERAAEGAPEHAEAAASDDLAGTREVEADLGKFGVTSFQPSTSTTLLIDFHLYGTIGAEEKAAFEKAMEGNQHRFRDQVIVIVRSAELTDLTDAGLGLIKRKILEKSNKLLGKPYLRSVIFSDFSFVEQ